MKQFLALYYTLGGHQMPPEMTPAEQEAMMTPWFAWRAKYGDQIADFGTPCMPASKSLDSRNWEESQSSIIGYSIVSAENMEAAQTMFVDHPVYNFPNHKIEISECVNM